MFFALQPLTVPDAIQPIYVLLAVQASLSFRLHHKDAVQLDGLGALQPMWDASFATLHSTATDATQRTIVQFVHLDSPLFQALQKAAAQLDPRQRGARLSRFV